MAGKSIKPQIPMSKIHYLPPADKPNQLDFLGPIRFKQRRFFILKTIDRYSRWPAACICEAPTGKTAKTFLEQIILLNAYRKQPRRIKARSLPETIIDQCAKVNLKLVYGTPYLHTATDIVERAIKTLKDLMRTILEDKCTVSEPLSLSLTVMRTRVPSSIKETPFERHYRKSRERKEHATSTYQRI